jgi:hypothetical protein
MTALLSFYKLHKINRLIIGTVYVYLRAGL